jgi:hypothetical protein
VDHPSIWKFISSTVKSKIWICLYYSVQYVNNNNLNNNLVVTKMYTS